METEDNANILLEQLSRNIQHFELGPKHTLSSFLHKLHFLHIHSWFTHWDENKTWLESNTRLFLRRRLCALLYRELSKQGYNN